MTLRYEYIYRSVFAIDRKVFLFMKQSLINSIYMASTIFLQSCKVTVKKSEMAIFPILFLLLKQEPRGSEHY